MGRRLPGILSGAGIGWTEVNSSADLKMVEQVLPEVYSKNRVHAFLMNPKVWENSDCGVLSSESGVGSSECDIPHDEIDVHRPSSLVHHPSPPTLTRYDIIKIISPYLKGKAVVSNLGWPSKELFAIKHQASNFYMLGSMGMATPIGLGIALSSSKQVVVIDGDGSLLMNPGTLATAASRAPKNLTILAIDNSAYGSTGNQPTLTGACVDLELVARGFGFNNTVKISTAEQLIAVMKEQGPGPSFIQVLAKPGNKDVPNIPIHHLEIKKQVQEFLKR
jgi:sulfopyruvate decarboxylase subunit beta